MLNTTLTRDWGLMHPLLQAPMANVAGGELAAAVSRSGGLGMIGIAPGSTATWIAEESAKARRGGNFGAGLMIWAVALRPELLDLVLQERPSVVALSFGDPAPYVEKVHAAGAKVVAQAQTAELARQAIAAGVDAVVAQGTEAGGHTGAVGTLPLLQIVLEMGEAAGIPVLAAGGIATGRGIAAALAAGSAGVWIGTPFIATEEAFGSEASRQRLIRATEADTVLTRVFDIVQEVPWPNEFPGRALANSFTETWHGRESELAAGLPDAQAGFAAARKVEDYAVAHIYAGQSVGLVREVVPASKLVERLMADAERVLRASGSLLG